RPARGHSARHRQPPRREGRGAVHSGGGATGTSPIPGAVRPGGGTALVRRRDRRPAAWGLGGSGRTSSRTDNPAWTPHYRPPAPAPGGSLGQGGHCGGGTLVQRPGTVRWVPARPVDGGGVGGIRAAGDVARVLRRRIPSPRGPGPGDDRGSTP